MVKKKYILIDWNMTLGNLACSPPQLIVQRFFCTKYYNSFYWAAATALRCSARAAATSAVSTGTTAPLGSETTGAAAMGAVATAPEIIGEARPPVTPPIYPLAMGAVDPMTAPPPTTAPLV